MAEAAVGDAALAQEGGEGGLAGGEQQERQIEALAVELLAEPLEGEPAHLHGDDVEDPQLATQLALAVHAGVASGSRGGLPSTQATQLPSASGCASRWCMLRPFQGLSPGESTGLSRSSSSR